MLEAERGKRLGLLSFIQVFSLDVVAGALCMTLMVARVSDTHIPAAFWFVLGLAVWSIYTFDHLLDALNDGARLLSVRHSLHFTFHLPLSILVLCTGITSVITALVFLPQNVLWACIILGSVSGLYYLALYFKADRSWPWFSKEFMVALIYTCGIWVYPLATGNANSSQQLLLAIVIFLTAMATLVMNGIFDYKEDKRGGFTSVAVHFGLPRARLVFWSLITLALIISGLAATRFMSAPTMAAFLFMLIIQAVLLTLHRNEEWSSQNMRYRFISDFMYILPILILFIPA